MFSVWVSPPTIIFISLGFAGLLGDQIHQLRSHLNRHQVVAVLALIGLVWLPPLSLPPVPQWLGWAAATLVIILFALRPNILPSQIFTHQFAWRYASLSMLLAAIWDLLAGPALPYHFLSLFALFAAFLTWKRSLSPRR
jgi:hypothetical protein